MSYKLHAELAAAHGGDKRWGYRKIHSGSLTAKGRSTGQEGAPNGKHSHGKSISLQKRDKEALGRLVAAGIPENLDWVAPDSARSYYEMGTPENTAQVHPYQFTTSMAELAEDKGVQVVLGSVSSINRSAGAVKSVTYEDKETSESHTIPATDVVVAAGPWTRHVYPPAPISAMRAHSVTIRPSKPISAYALFTEISLPPDFGRTATFLKSKQSHRKQVTPEIYARPNNEAYACGEGDTMVPLPKTTADVVTDDSRCQDIIDYVSSISDELKDGEVTARQACYLPNVQAASGGPLIGETGVKGLLIAAGHTCWGMLKLSSLMIRQLTLVLTGIQNGPGTGKLISEFIFEGKAKSASIGSLDPRKVL